MASCGETLLPCENASISDSSIGNRCAAPIAGETESPTQSKIAWGGAGMVLTQPGGSGKKAGWAPSETNIPKTSFRDLQSEDLAKEITRRESEHLQPFLPGLNLDVLHKQQLEMQAPTPLASTSSPDASSSSTSYLESASPAVAPASGLPIDAEDATDNDFAVAQALQYEYDLQHDMAIERNQKQCNKNSKLSISYSKFKVLPTFAPKSDDVSLNDDDPIDEIEAGELDEPCIPACGFVQHEGKFVTKHDSAITARKNTKKMLNFLPLDVNTGDAGGFTINMPNKVFNNLNASSQNDSRKKQRIHDKAEKGTLGSHMDKSTSLALLTMVNAGVLSELGGIISTGKEAVVYHAVVGSLSDTVDDAELHQGCVVKIFKTRLAEFKTRDRYIRDDHRFKDRMTKTNNFSNIKLWVEKEFRNLCRVRSAGLSCPTPLYVRSNLLVMSLIGDPDLPAPQIRNVYLSNAKWELAYQETLQMVHDMTNKCRLVHADLSEYNLLYHNNEVYIIDFAQAVDITHPNALSYLYRDLCNIANFFHRKGVANVKTGVELLEEVTKLDIRRCSGHSNTEEAIEATERELALWRGSDCYDDGIYDFLWNAAQMRQQLMKNLDFPDSELQHNLAGLTLTKSGNSYKEQWITKKTDGSINNKGQQQKKKKKTRKNSGGSKTGGGESSKITEELTAVASELLPEDEASGFCLVNSSDCDGGVSSTAECCNFGLFDTQIVSQRLGQRVRFDVEDTDAVESEDYNADADTDDLDADTDDVDTDLNATDHDCDTEGYHADADDTDNNASDVNSHKITSKRSCKGAPAVDMDDSSDQQNSSTVAHRSVKLGTPDKRISKKKNKKSKARNSCN